MGADIANPDLQGYADYDGESKEEGVFPEQLSPQGWIFDKNSRREIQNQVGSAKTC